MINTTKQTRYISAMIYTEDTVKWCNVSSNLCRNALWHCDQELLQQCCFISRNWKARLQRACWQISVYACLLHWPLPSGAFQGHSKTNNSTDKERQLAGGRAVGCVQAQARTCTRAYNLEQIQLLVREGLEVGVTEIQALHSNHSIILILG